MTKRGATVAWEDPKSAPAPLDLVQALVNTAHRMHGTDQFQTAAQATAALAALGITTNGEHLTEADRQRLVAFREALRALLIARNDRQDMAAAVVEIDHACGTIPMQARFASTGILSIGPDLAAPITDQIIGSVIAAIVAAPDDWERLKACSNDACRWAFFDASRNRSGRWCDMNVCGARHKMRTYRQRNR